MSIKCNSYTIKKDIQNDFASRSRPFGGFFRTEHAYMVPSVTYKKNFFNNKLKLSQFLVYSHINYQLTDSVKNTRYDWMGQRHTTVSSSEMGTELSKLGKPVIQTNLHNVTYRGLFKYDLKDNQQLILNIVNNYFTRTSDDLNKYQTQTHIKYNRFIAGLGYRYSFFDQRMEALSQVKF